MAYRLPRLALESTLLAHGVPPSAGLTLARELHEIVVVSGVEPALLAIDRGQPASLDADRLRTFLAAGSSAIAKLNTGSLGPSMGRPASGATTVSTTMELAAMMGIRVFSTGGLGGVHKDFAHHLDISTDLLAFTRFPVAVVTAGCKSILDIPATRELLETLGVPVIGYRTDRFPAFYRRDGGLGVDARFDDIESLAIFVRRELARTRRGIVVCNAIPPEHELPERDWNHWLKEAEDRARASGATGRAVTPAVLAALHEISQGRTLKANIELVKHNVRVGAELAAAIGV